MLQTSLTTPHDYRRFYRWVQERRYDIHSFHFSVWLINKYNSATQAKLILVEKIMRLMDSASGAIGINFQALGGVRTAFQRAVFKEEKEIAFRDRQEFLLSGSRIGRAAVLLGSRKHIKPLMKIRRGLIPAANRMSTMIGTIIVISPEINPHIGPTNTIRMTYGRAINL